MVSIDAFQALDLGSIPGRRIPFSFLFRNLYSFSSRIWSLFCTIAFFLVKSQYYVGIYFIPNPTGIYLVTRKWIKTQYQLNISKEYYEDITQLNQK